MQKKLNFPSISLDKSYVKLLIICLFFSLTLFASQERRDKLESTIAGALQYLEQTQVKEYVGFTHLKGEWETFMINAGGVPLLGGKGAKGRDSNCFATATIHNLLAETYMSNKSLDKIPAMLNLAIENIKTYRDGDSFNFWPLVPAIKGVVKRKEYNSGMSFVRGPNGFQLNSRFMRKAANIANDADDTAQSYAALKLNEIINSSNDNEKIKIAPIFDEYRDIGRKKAHTMNLLGGLGSKTGAYLTWHAQEGKFFGITDFFPNKKGEYVVFGVNDIDGVVNSNVLYALALYGELGEAEGVEASCALLKKCIKSGLYGGRCDMYYPNRYTLHYAAVHAMTSGVSCLKGIEIDVIRDLKENQNEDGSWSLKWIDDTSQSTAFALNALLDSGVRNREVEEMIEKGVDYLLKIAKVTGLGVFIDEVVFWDGGVFFSGGTIIYHSILWKSDAVTTAYIVAALEKYRQRL